MLQQLLGAGGTPSRQHVWLFRPAPVEAQIWVASVFQSVSVTEK